MLVFNVNSYPCHNSCHKMKNFLLLFILTFFVNTFAQCPPEGSSKSARLQALDRLKNRDTAPVKLSPSVSLEHILAPGNDADRFTPDEAGTITGYVIAVKNGGKESCNCDDPKLLDTHIVIGLTAKAKPKDCMIAEITPRWRAKHPQWTTANIRKLIGKPLTLTGWLLYDSEHANASFHTAKRSARCWRATAWEIHPITNIPKLP